MTGEEIQNECTQIELQMDLLRERLEFIQSNICNHPVVYMDYKANHDGYVSQEDARWVGYKCMDCGATWTEEQ